MLRGDHINSSALAASLLLVTRTGGEEYEEFKGKIRERGFTESLGPVCVCMPACLITTTRLLIATRAGGKERKELNRKIAVYLLSVYM